MVLGLRQFDQRTGDGAGGPVLDTDNGEEMMHMQPGVAVALGNRSPESPGTLYISTRKVVWLSDVDSEKGYAVDFLSLSLHAVSRDPEAYPSPCIYTQLHEESLASAPLQPQCWMNIETEADEDESEGSDSESNEALDLSKVTEMRLIPSEPSQLDTLFQVFCECAELNPEPVDEDDEERHNWIFGANQIADGDSDVEESEWLVSQNLTSSIGHSNGDHDLARNVLELQINDQRFEDAEEVEHDRDGSSHQ